MNLHERILIERNESKRQALIAEYDHRRKWNGIADKVKAAKGFKSAMAVAAKLTGYGFSDNLTFVQGVRK